MRDNTEFIFIKFLIKMMFDYAASHTNKVIVRTMQEKSFRNYMKHQMHFQICNKRRNERTNERKNRQQTAKVNQEFGKRLNKN